APRRARIRRAPRETDGRSALRGDARHPRLLRWAREHARRDGRSQAVRSRVRRCGRRGLRGRPGREGGQGPPGLPSSIRATRRRGDASDPRPHQCRDSPRVRIRGTDFLERDPCIHKDDIEPASVISVGPAWSGTAMVDDHIKRKILLLGDGAVGKTSLIRRFVVDKFSDEYITTIGTKVTKKDLRIESPGKAIDLTFMIWDVLGQKGYKGIQESSFQGAKGALLMYDVTRLETAESLQNYWIPHLLVVTNPIPLVVVGNKVDLADSRRQAQEELDDLKEALGVTGFLSSAKTGQNVE